MENQNGFQLKKLRVCGRSHVNVLICQAERIKGAVRLLSRLRVRCFRFSLLYFYKAEGSPLDN